MTDTPTIHRLLVTLKRGQPAAFDELYMCYGELFYYHARKRGLTHEEAYDTVQETFLRILDHIDTYDEVKGGGKSWMWRIHSNVVNDKLRERTSIPLTETISGGMDPAGKIEDETRRECLLSAWNRISKADRDTIQRRWGKRGPPSKAWREAVQRLKIAFHECYRDTE